MIDRSKLTLDQVAMLDQHEATQKQIKLLEDVAATLKSVPGQLKSDKTEALLADIKGLLRDPSGAEAPDFSPPIVEALQSLESAVKAIEVKPEVSVAPAEVNVAAPQVEIPEVDLSGVEKVLREDIPQAFQKAIASIPPVEIPEDDDSALLDSLSQISEQLSSIDIATRMKPQFPNTLKVTNPDGTSISDQTAYVTRIDDTTTTSVTYIGKATSGSITSSAVWQIKKIDETTGTVITWADGNKVFDNVWDNRAGLSYS